MDFSISELNLNSVETLPGYEARAAFTVNSYSVFKEDELTQKTYCRYLFHLYCLSVTGKYTI